MALPKSFSAIQCDPQGREFVTHKPSGVRYYINRKIDPKLRGTTGLRSTPYSGEELSGPTRTVGSVISGGEPLPVRPQPVHVPPFPGDTRELEPRHVPASRAPIRARFIKGSAPRGNNEYL